MTRTGSTGSGLDAAALYAGAAPGVVDITAYSTTTTAATDTAVLKIDPSGLTLHPLLLGSLATLRIGARSRSSATLSAFSAASAAV